MKNIIIIIFIALLISLSLASFGSGVPVMDGPSETANQIGTIQSGTAYTVLQDTGDGWALIEYFSGDYKRTGFIKQ